MMKWEARLATSIKKNILWWGLAAVLLLGVFIRYSFMPLLVADMEFMNLGWYEGIKAGGMKGALAPELQYTYSPLHLYLWTLTAVLFPSLPSMETLKVLSLLFEVPVILLGCLLVYRLLPAPRKALGTWVAFTLLWLHPLLLLNVAGWGQTDVFYVAPSLLALYLLMKDKPGWAMVALGVALAFKLQAIFLLPAFAIAYFCREKKFSLLWFLLVPLVWVATGLPMVFLGESPLYAVECYFGQTDLYTKPTYNYPNWYALLGDALSSKRMIQGMLSRYGMVLAVGALGGMATWLIAKKVQLTDRTLLLLSSWCVLCCCFLLPRMHERYGLVGEVLLVCWAVCLGKPRGFAYVLLGLLPIASAYCQYMFRNPMFSLQLGSVLNLALLGLLTWEMLRETKALQPIPRDVHPAAEA